MTGHHTPTLSLLTAYRGREHHLSVLLPWLARVREEEGFADFELILAEGDAQPTAARLAAEYPWVRYAHVPMTGNFRKAVLLNRGAALARGRFRSIHDVDMLPAEGVLALQLGLASESPRCLVTGYRVQLPEMPPAAPLPTTEELLGKMSDEDPSLICGEDDYGGFLKHLIARESFGVCPFYPAHLFDAVGGLDEGYVGWGPEDQDFIDRICGRGVTLVRAYELLYFHMPHENEPGWFDQTLIAANRRRLAEAQRARLINRKTGL
jgi:hypothetical protein